MWRCVEVIRSISQCKITIFTFNSSGKFSGTIGKGTGIIWLDDLRCKGNELTLADCVSSGWGEENCDHTEDVGIECFNSNDGKQLFENIHEILIRTSQKYSPNWYAVIQNKYNVHFV